MPYSSVTTSVSNRIGKRSQRSFLTEKEAKQTALRVLKERSLSPLAFQTVDALTTAGVLTTRQLKTLTHVSVRSLNRYHFQHLVDHLYAPTQLTAFSFPLVALNSLRLYTLGTLGLAIAAEKGHLVPSYAGYSSRQITHDVLCNQVALNLIQFGQAKGYTPIWYSKYEARVYGQEGGKTKCVLEPDALLVFSKPNSPKRAFIIEYHNEDHRNRTRDKVERYEREARNPSWRDVWPLDTFPLVLAAFTHKAVADGYTEAVAHVRGRGLRCRFLGKQFAVTDAQPAQWWDFEAQKLVDIFSL
jgi:hypothetical protein